MSESAPIAPAPARGGPSRKGVARAFLLSLVLGAAAVPFADPHVTANLYPWSVEEVAGSVVAASHGVSGGLVTIDTGGPGRKVTLPVLAAVSIEKLPKGAKVFKRAGALSMQVDGAEWVPLVPSSTRASIMVGTWLAASLVACALVFVVMALAKLGKGGAGPPQP